MTFQDHMRRMGARALEAFPEALRPQIYVISFRIWRNDSFDDRHPYLAIGYNTEDELRRVPAEQRDPDPDEARWNYAWWPLDEIVGVIGHDPADPTGAALHTAEVKELGLWYEDDDDDDADADADADDDDDDDEASVRNELLELHFDEACIDLARHLHSSGRITEILGRPVPIVLFDMYRAGYEETLTEAANPPEVVADYLAWCRES
ncbi:hypothetical protein ACH4SK_38280 [Streptomyces inhibens]|uniref:hypothetical protein n=1 Tax=Streptomyces inhibens TaxID=2293571 RepID=UPI0037B9646F